MLSVTITEKDGPSTTTTFDKTEVSIGRVKGNDIVLPKSNISKRHSRLIIKDDRTILIDLKSTNGTFVNGQKITAPHVMQDSDKIFIGDFTIEVHATASSPAMPPAAPAVGVPSAPAFAEGPNAHSLPPIGAAPHLGAAGAPQMNFDRPSLSLIHI